MAVCAHPAQAADLVALAEALQIPVATSLNGKDVIPGNHPLAVGVVGTYSRQSANRVVNGADLVCFIGSETGGMTTHFWAVPKIGTPAIQIDIDPEALGRNYPLLAGVNGDAKVDAGPHARGGRPRTAPASAKPGSRKRPQNMPRNGRRSTRPTLDLRRRSDPPRAHLRANSPGTCRTTASSWSIPATAACGWGVSTISPVPAQSYMRSAGHLGWAFPAGLGAKCACPDRPVVTFTGDAGLLVPHRRDRDGGALAHQRRHRGQQQLRAATSRSAVSTASMAGTQTEQAREMWAFSKVNFARIAEDMGAVGIRVEQAGGYRDRRSRRGLKANRPVIIDVVTDIDAPRRWR